MPLTDVKPADFSARPIVSQRSRVEQAIQARRGIKSKSAKKGRTIGYTQNPSSGEVHVAGSIVAQLMAGANLEDGVSEEHIRYRKIAGRGRRHILFIVDTSGSMIGAGRLALAKGCVISLLSDAYVTRTRVALICFGGAKASLVLPFTSSVEMAAHRIDNAKGGGATPFFEALELAVRLIGSVEDEPVEVVVLSDGGYSRPRGVQTDKIVLRFGEYCQKFGIPIHFVDSGRGGRTAKHRAERLAKMLHADYRTLDDLRIDNSVPPNAAVRG